MRKFYGGRNPGFNGLRREKTIPNFPSLYDSTKEFQLDHFAQLFPR
jgi:hypothetical protein